MNAKSQEIYLDIKYKTTNFGASKTGLGHNDRSGNRDIGYWNFAGTHTPRLITLRERFVRRSLNVRC